MPGPDKIKVAVAADFLSAFARIPRKQQARVLDFVNKFREDPTSPGINYEKIRGARDPSLRSVRIDQAYRGIVLKPESGNVYGYQIDYGNRTQPLWEKALALIPGELGLDHSFYREEWEQIIQLQSVTSLAEYIKASRVGRGVRLSRKQRKAIWPVFEDYRLQLDEQGLREPEDATREAGEILVQKGDILPYQAVIVDDLDGGQDDQKGYKSLLHGVMPEVRNFETFEDEVDCIANDLNNMASEGDTLNEVCIVARTHEFLEHYRSVLDEKGFETHLIRRSEPENRKLPGGPSGNDASCQRPRVQSSDYHGCQRWHSSIRGCSTRIFRSHCKARIRGPRASTFICRCYSREERCAGNKLRKAQPISY
jgi:hypothetical protein